MVTLADLLDNFGVLIAAVFGVSWALVANRTKALASGDPWKSENWKTVDAVRVPILGYLHKASEPPPRAHGFLSQLRLDLGGTVVKLGWLLSFAVIAIAVLRGNIVSLCIGLAFLGLLAWQTTKVSRLVAVGVRARARVLDLSDAPTFFTYGTANVSVVDPKLGNPINVALPWWPLRSLKNQGDVEVVILFDPQNPEHNLFIGVSE